jgi:hypothetical protein
VTKLCHYLESQVVPGILTIEDCEVAAAQFLDSCVATILKPLLFNASEAPSDGRIDHVVGIAVRTFLAAYRLSPDPAPSGGVNPIEQRLVFQTRDPTTVRGPRRPKRAGKACGRIGLIVGIA